MRVIPSTMWELWSNGGPLIGDAGAPHGRVTLEPDWLLHVTADSTIGSYSRGPIRWWQRADDSQHEVEVPNIEQINIDRSIDQDAATCTITLQNQWHFVNGEIAVNDAELGQPGYFTFNRGESIDAQARWGHTTNIWNRYLVPNALLRTYQGYGGNSLTINDALVEGNLVLTGVWLVDEVRLGADGKIELRCRDMAKLLIEQQMYPPLVPGNQYPVKFCRWAFRTMKGNRIGVFVPPPFLGTLTTPVMISGAVDYGGDIPEPDIPDFIGNEPGNGYWTLDINGKVYNFGNNPNYGNSNGIWTQPQFECIQIVSTATGAGYWVLRRDGNITTHGDAVHYGTHNYNPSIGGPLTGWVNESPCAMARTHTGNGYWLMDSAGRVYAFGDAVHHGNHTGTHFEFPVWYESRVAITIVGHPTGSGYWTLDSNGGVQAHGIAVNYGDPDPFIAVGETHDNIIRTFRGMASTPAGDGYWITDQAGRVFAYGAAQYLGQIYGNFALGHSEGMTVNWPNAPHADFAVSIQSTPSGNGYWIFGNAGGVFPFGDAVYYGSADRSYSVFLRENGNYKDYADIIKDILLWSGWWLQTDVSTDEWMEVEYDASVAAWETATTLCTVGFAKTSWLVPWDSNFPDNTAEVLWGSNGTLVYADDGDCLFRQFITVPATGTYTLFVINDNAGVYYVDGQKVVSSTSFTSTTSVNIDLDAGSHLVATRGTNFVQAVSNPAGIAWALYLGPTLIAHSDASECAVLEYPREIGSTGDEVQVYGNIEYTGAFSSECLPDNLFDKQPPINAINAIKEIVGYIFWIDDEGAAHFESPNIWTPGNFLEDGTHTSFIPDIDERLQITDFAAQVSDKTVRSEIVISSNDPTVSLSDTITTRFIPPNANTLRGMVKPAIWVNEVFTEPKEQRVMAELVSLHAWLAQRQASLTCLANPAFQINDQVRIWERVTSETYIHYIRGYSSQMNIPTGSYTMTLNTHWMGDNTQWAVEIGRDNFSFQDLDEFIEKPLTYVISTSDIASETGVIHGHRGTDAYDGNLNTFWLTPGNASQLQPYAVEYIQFDVNDMINIAGIYPWGGNYDIYISIREGGLWRGTDIIPYDPIGTGLYVGDDTAEIPYIKKVSVAWETPQLVALPRIYSAEAIRFTLSNLQRSQWGPYHYRGGLRDVTAGFREPS